MRSTVSGSLAAAVLASAGVASAQDQPLNPDAVPIRGDEPADYGSPMPVEGAPSGVLVQPGRQAGRPQPETGALGGQGEGIYLGDDYYTDPGEEQAKFLGQVPELHVVRRGDTLWDLCGYYFDDPWRWPKIWSYNPTITNPHWIYPGDVVRLYGEGEVAPVKEINRVDAPTMAFDDATQSDGVELRQLAFVRPEELKLAGKIVGSSEDKLLLTQGDEIFIEYPAGKPPQIGKRYAIYTPKEDVRHPDGKAKVGSYVLLRGEVQILEVKKDKKARGPVTYVTGVVERGYNVGPVKTQFRDVKPVPAEKNLEGVVVGLIDAADDLIGEGMIVLIDRGKKDGVKPGHTLQIIRRGDAYKKDHRMAEGGRDDRAYPDEVIGAILVVDVSEQASIALVTKSVEEALVGDHVLMRKGK